jgi:hypothetical protein
MTSIHLEIIHINIHFSLFSPFFLKHLPNPITGVLEKEWTRCLIHNYNLIYNLSLSPQKIDQALRRFYLRENVLLEPPCDT